MGNKETIVISLCIRCRIKTRNIYRYNSTSSLLGQLLIPVLSTLFPTTLLGNQVTSNYFLHLYLNNRFLNLISSGTGMKSLLSVISWTKEIWLHLGRNYRKISAPILKQSGYIPGPGTPDLRSVWTSNGSMALCRLGITPIQSNLVALLQIQMHSGPPYSQWPARSRKEWLEPFSPDQTPVILWMGQ